MGQTNLQSLIDNRLSPGPWPGWEIDQQAPFDERAAYLTQFELHVGLSEAGLGDRIGWKIGCTTPVMQKFMSIDHPCSGGITERCVHFDHFAGAYADFNRVGVECEIAVTFGEDLPPKKGAYMTYDLAPLIQSCRAAMEIVDDRYADFTTLTTETMIVDDFFQSACVLGPEISNWREIDLAEVTGRTIVNDVEVGSGRGRDIMGHPLNALVWLANNLTDLGRSLKAGEFVMLGSMVECQWLSLGDKVEMQISNLGSISAQFTK
jgi:2-keto-4-pentenoate hydratase